MEKTALEFILNMVCGKDEKGKDVRVKDYLNVHDIEQAKDFEKEQLKDAYDAGIWDVGCKAPNFDEYYKRSFKSE